jgi:hypothetical protein
MSVLAHPKASRMPQRSGGGGCRGGKQLWWASLLITTALYIVIASYLSHSCNTSDSLSFERMSKYTTTKVFSDDSTSVQVSSTLSSCGIARRHLFCRQHRNPKRFWRLSRKKFFRYLFLQLCLFADAATRRLFAADFLLAQVKNISGSCAGAGSGEFHNVIFPSSVLHLVV